MSSPAHSEPPSSSTSEPSQSPSLVAVSSPAPALTDSQKMSVTQRLQVLRARYSQLEAVLFFAAGFTFADRQKRGYPTYSTKTNYQPGK